MTQTYESPLTARYSSHEMSRIFSPQFKHSTWRRLWVELARAQHVLGLPIALKEIDELVQQIAVIDAIRPISPRSLDDMTHNRVENLVSTRLGYWFEIDTPSWANIATAWFATEHLPFRARCEILTKRLTLNV